MIKFFRSIRKKLLSENRFSKYLLYAIGEIILVMIGILLALQVNNWNNERIEQAKEQVLLKNLQVDFKNNIDNLEAVYLIFEEAYNASADLLAIIQDSKPLEPKVVDKLVDDIVNKTMSYDLITGSINEVFNTGSLHCLN